jgi:hypothetical protein
VSGHNQKLSHEAGPTSLERKNCTDRTIRTHPQTLAPSCGFRILAAACPCLLLNSEPIMPALKAAILSLPREERAAFMYAYQHAPHTVKAETPLARFAPDALADNDDNDTAEAAVHALAEAAAARLCSYWKYKWILFYNEDDDHEESRTTEAGPVSEPPHECRGSTCNNNRNAAAVSTAESLQSPSRFLRPTSLSHLTEGARIALASGYLTILPDVSVISKSFDPIESCPVVCFDSTLLRRQRHQQQQYQQFHGRHQQSVEDDHDGTASYLQSTFYFWNMLCQERWQQQDEQREAARGVHHGGPAIVTEASATRYVGLILIDPDTVLDDTVQAWVDMTLASVPMHAHSLHVLACTTPASSGAASSSYGGASASASSAAHFYAVVLPRTIKVFGKLMREQEVQIHVKSDPRDFAELLQNQHGIPASVLPRRIGGTLCDRALWTSRIAHQASLEGTSDLLPQFLPPSEPPPPPEHDPGDRLSFLSHDASFAGPLQMYLDDNNNLPGDDGANGFGAIRFPWEEEDAAAAGLRNQEATNDVVDSLLCFHASEGWHTGSHAVLHDQAVAVAVAACPCLPAAQSADRGVPVLAASERRILSLDEAMQLAYAEDMVGKDECVAADLTALRDALSAAPERVQSETPWEQLMSRNQCAHWPALAQADCWWRLRRELFGAKAWLKPMTQTGEGALSRKEISFLRSSECIQFLPLDVGGRSVLYVDLVEALSLACREQSDHMVLLRCLYYAFYVVATDRSSKSALVLVSPDRGTSVPFDTFLERHRGFCSTLHQLWGSTPLVLGGIHLLPMTTQDLSCQRLSNSVNRIGVYELYGLQAHRSCCTPLLLRHESFDTLSQHGLSVKNLPTSVGGAFGRLQFSQWLELRVRYEWCVPAGTRNKALLDMFDFSHVKPLSELSGDELAERKRRMNILHTRRKRDRENQEELSSRDQIAALSSDNIRIRGDNTRLEKMLEWSRAELLRQGLPDPSTTEIERPMEYRSSPEAPIARTEAPPSDDCSDGDRSSSCANVVSNDDLAERTRSRNRLYSQRKRDKDRNTVEALSQQIEDLTARNRAVLANNRKLEDRLHAALWEVSLLDPSSFLG